MAEGKLNVLIDFDNLPAVAVVPVDVVAALFSVSELTVWRRAKAGGIPAPRRYGPKCTRWNVGELRAALGGAQ
ncbi:UNVERIFIED_ORG: putative DNA-binding transcriptional regulator AlpA [Variovorax guangxiensis]